ncbi:MAG: GNAT family N-acetyltransferase [Bacteroidota bacterium]|jgi:CelD/BcsL family acetyltransferase involved in cellulose biosynthesis|nr:GNAT family N-acetyltransferase [Bacteroidota bacterium]
MSDVSLHTISLRTQQDTWESLRSASVEATVFTSARWLTTLAAVFNRDPAALVAMRGDRCLAGTPLLTHQRGPLRVAAPLPITLYAGIVRTPLATEALVPLLAAIEQRYHFVSLGARWSDEDHRILRTRGWITRSRQTLHVRLGDSQAVWEGYSQSLRRKLRHIPDGGFVLDHDPSTATIVAMFEQSYRRHGVRPPLPPSALERWLHELRECGLAHCFAALHPDGRPAAVRVVLRDDATVYDWLAGADLAVAPSASHWLVHHILERFSSQGCTLFDFMGANTPGVVDFKRGFGGTAVPYMDAEWYRPTLLRHLDAMRHRGIRLRRGLR